MVREEQVAAFTLPWPPLRRALLTLGGTLCAHALFDDPGQVFFLTRAELLAALRGQAAPDLRARAEARLATWERQRRLTPPLAIGALPSASAGLLAQATTAMRSPSAHSGAVLRGQPASPGRATGRVRLVRGPEDYALVQAGEVLVGPVTTPAWTVLFPLAAAVVSDGGSMAAHASLVAREYGIPAVVATGDATARLRDGQLVTVDGSAGVVELHG